MPRELSMLTTEPATVVHLLLAAVEVDATLVPRVLFDGWVTQLVDTEDRAVVSVELSRPVEVAVDVERLTGLAVPSLPCWLTGATAPWGPAGETGVAVVRALAALLDGRLAVEDGA